MNVGSRARRLTALALLTFMVAIPAGVVARRAGAGWLPATTSSHGSGAVRITSKPVGGLYPGAKRTLILTLRNRNSKYGIEVRRVRVRNVGTTKRGCAPARRNLGIRQPRIQMLRIRPRGVRRVAALLIMPNTVADACQGAVFKLRYSAQARTRRPPR
jgi:hypothetical protein